MCMKIGKIINGKRTAYKVVKVNRVSGRVSSPVFDVPYVKGRNTAADDSSPGAQSSMDTLRAGYFHCFAGLATARRFAQYMAKREREYTPPGLPIARVHKVIRVVCSGEVYTGKNVDFFIGFEGTAGVACSVFDWDGKFLSLRAKPCARA